MTFADIKYAARSLRRCPGLVAIATLSLGLGIGVNTALYSVFQTVFLQPPAAADPDHLVRLEPGNSNLISYPNYRDLAAGNSFAGLGAYAMTRLSWRMGEDVDTIPGMIVSPNFFSLVGLSTQLGRGLSAQDETGAVITHEFWTVKLNARPSALGSTLHLNGQSFVVQGILPPGHRSIAGAMGPSIYVLAGRLIAPQVERRNQMSFNLIGRLNRGVSFAQAVAAVTAQGQALERTYPKDDEGLGQAALAFPIYGLGSWQERGTPLAAVVGLAAIPFAIFGLVLLIACANVAGLLLARGADRSREIAIRQALGAPRFSLVRMLLAESFLLALCGSGAGLLMNLWLCAFIEKIPLPQAPGPLTVVPDYHAMFFALALALVTTLLCGLTPALASTHGRIHDILKRDSGAGRQRRFLGRRVLVVGQVAVSMVLLFLSIFFLRSLAFLSSVDPGFDIDHIVVAYLNLPHDLPDEPRRLAAIQTRAAVANVPGVQSASVTSIVPLGGDDYAGFFGVNGGEVSNVETFMQNVGAGYFQTVATPLRLGREFNAADRAGAPMVAVVNEEFVRAHGIASAPIGTTVRAGNPGRTKEPSLQIVGVVADSKYSFFGERPKPILYRPFMQAGGRVFIVARTAGSPAASIAPLKRAIADENPTLLVEPKTMRDATSLEFQLRRLGAALLGMVGLLGLALSMIGLYGIMAYAVNRRTAEIGIRMALGATRPKILTMVFREGLSLVSVGLSAGILAALAASGPLEFLMGGVSTRDPLTLIATAALLLLSGLAAAYVPAARATQIAPAIALRSE
jgi:predicted permease